jgi:FKBP-type peptidyl-prolyl cis-trans isomerase 2
MTIEDGDEVTFEYVARLEDGTVFDTSREAVAARHGLDGPGQTFSPLTVQMGIGELIDGLEDGLLGLEAGDEERFVIPPEDGYGEWKEQHVMHTSLDSFMGMTEGKEPEEGKYVTAGRGQQGVITDVGDDEIEIDFNHEHAGETLVFEIEVLDVE